MVQQSELLRYLQGRVVLEGLGFPPHLPGTKEQNDIWVVILEWKEHQ